MAQLLPDSTMIHATTCWILTPYSVEFVYKCWQYSKKEQGNLTMSASLNEWSVNRNLGRFP